MTVYDKDQNKDQADSLNSDHVSEPSSSTHHEAGRAHGADSDKISKGENSAGASDGQVDKDLQDKPVHTNESYTNPDGSSVDFYNKNDEPSKKSKISGLASGVGSLGKKKLILGIVGPIGLIIIIFLLMSLLKIPNYAANVAAYRLARTAIEYSKTSAAIDAEKVAIDAADETTFGALKEKYSSLRESTWGKLDKYRPKIVIENMQGEGFLKYETSTIKRLGVNVDAITDVIIKEEKIPIPKNSLLHPIESYKAKLEFANRIDRGLDKALRGSNSIIRSNVAKNIRAKAGIRLVWWDNLGRKFLGKTANEADILLLEESTAKITTRPAEAVSADIKEATKEGDKILAECAKDKQCVKTLLKDKLPDSFNKVFSKLESSAVRSLTGILNTVYAIAVPACLIFDGSLENSSSDIDAQSASATKSFYALTSAADQQKAGDTTNEAIGAMNRKLGEGDSIPDQYMRSVTVDTTTEKSPQSSTGGTFSILNALVGNSAAVDVINVMAESVCPVMTNIWLNLAIGVVALIPKIVAAIGSGGLTVGVEGAVELSIKAAIKNMPKTLFKSVFKHLATWTAIKASGKAVGGFLGKFGVWLGAVEGATFVSRLIVFQKLALVNDGGRASGASFRNVADMGGDIQNNELNRQMFYGAPMTDAQVAINDTKVIAYLDSQEKTKPAFERYFATSNPRSLISRISYQVGYIKNIKVNSVFIKILSTLNFSTITNIFFPTSKYALAGNASISSHYGIVQWGWTDSENALINSSESYGVLENAKIVEESGKIPDIEAKYGICFSETMGNLLSQGKIIRTESGDIIQNEGDCSPQNLGPNNSTYGDMVFRYRLYKKRENVLEHNLGIQEPTADVYTGTTALGGSCEGLILGEKATTVHGGNQVIDGHDQYLLPAGPGYEFVRPNDSESHWGSKELVETIYQVGKKWAAKYPDTPFRVGDLDESQGHETHVKGINVDISGCPMMQQGCSNYNRAMSIELAKMFFEAGNITSILYNDGIVEDAVEAYARQNNLPGYVNWHEGHLNHFHVTIINGQAPEGCN